MSMARSLGRCIVEALRELSIQVRVPTGLLSVGANSNMEGTAANAGHVYHAIVQPNPHLHRDTAVSFCAPLQVHLRPKWTLTLGAYLICSICAPEIRDALSS